MLYFHVRIPSVTDYYRANLCEIKRREDHFVMI